LKVFKLYDKYIVLRLLIISGVYGVLEVFLRDLGFKGNYINDDNIGIIFWLLVGVGVIKYAKNWNQYKYTR